MKRLKSRKLLPAVTAVLTLAMCLGGCGGQDAELRGRLEEAYSHLQKSSQHIEGLESFQGRWEKAATGAQSGESTEEMKKLLEEARDTEEAALAELEKGARTLYEASRMPASEEMKRYLKMKLDAVGEQGKALEVELEAMKVRLDMLDDSAAGAVLDSETVRKMRLVGELEKESRSHAEEASRLDQEAKDYYESKKLQ